MSSSSGTPLAPVRLAVTADPGTEISLIDHNFQLRVRTIGALNTELAPGLYKLRYRTGLTVREAYQVIEPGNGVVEVTAPPMAYSSAAPLSGTRGGERYYQVASELSRKVHAGDGNDSQVFVFAWRDPEEPSRAAKANPAAGLSLHHRDGTRLFNLGKLAKRARATDRWAGCTVAVPPGEYLLRSRLRLAVPRQHHIEQAIVASPGWQTQVFLSPSPGGPAEDGRYGGLPPAGTSVLLARIGHGFDAQRSAARLADLARIAMTDRRAVIDLADLPGELAGESANPMLGIYTAHALLRAGGFDPAQLGEIIGSLRSILGKHPDVEALAHALGQPDPGYVFDCPPMLMGSWSLMLAAAARQPSLVPAGSLSERVSAHLWGAGPWLLWLGDKVPSAPPPRTVTDVPGMITQVADAALLGYPSRRAALGHAGLTDTEEALLTRVSRPFEAAGDGGAPKPSGQLVHPGKSPDLGKSPDISKSRDLDRYRGPDASREPALDISRDLAEALDLPLAAIPPVADSLMRKLERTARARSRFRRLQGRLRGPLARVYLRVRRRDRISRQRVWRGRRALQIGPVVLGILAIFWLTSVIGLVSTMFRGSPPGFEIAADDILSAILALSLSLTAGSAVFLWRRSRMHLPFLRIARDRPHRTVGGAAGDAAGRDELCRAIVDDLRDRRTRRPQVIVGGVGAGKTTLLAQLAKLLAEQGALPVQVRLGDARHSLNFRDLAHQRFIAEDDAAPLSDADGEEVWRHLVRHDKIVILADDLEEALASDPGARDKPGAQDQPGKKQQRENLIRLALRQAGEHGRPLVVASRPGSSFAGTEAAVVELEPLSEDNARQWLRNASPDGDERRLDQLVTAYDVTESPFYLQITRQLQAAGLMPDITARLGHGSIDEPVADRTGLRFLLLETWMESLLAGRLAREVPLSPADRQAAVAHLSALACLGLERGARQVAFDDFEALRVRKPRSALIAGVAGTLSDAGRPFDIGLAALWGAELGLVEAGPEGVRFPDSLMEAYLGSRLIETAMDDPRYQDAALADPGREFLLALVMNSRASTRRPVPGKAGPSRPSAHGSGRSLVDLLRGKATEATGATALDLYAAALQIDCTDQSPAHGEIAREVADRWPGLAAQDQRSLDQAKLNLVRGLSEAVGTVAARQRAERDYPGKPAYRQLFRIAATEPAHPVRMEIAQQIGALGDAAFDALQDLLAPPRDLAGAAIDVRESIVAAWLAPLLAGSVTYSVKAAQKNLSLWLRFVGQPGGRGMESGLRLSLEVALAQGFKYAANRHDAQPHANPQANAILLEQARDMLGGTSFWFSRLTLVHALCLMSLATSPARRNTVRRRDADHATLVGRWADPPDGGPEHPFVAEARTLAVRALETGQPERFIWIDEGSVAARIGSSPADPSASRWHNLWIPASAGWAALHPRAQKLLADVVLLVNLAERGADPGDGSRNLQRTSRPYPPPCLVHDRLALDPARTISRERTSVPGSGCVDGCPVDLCPYPPRGAKTRVELSEAFCRRQAALVKWRVLPRRSELRRFWRDMAQRPHL